MGQRVANVELVNDYSTQEGCVRLHIDLPLDKDEMRRFRRMMDVEDFKAAFAVVRESTTENNYDILDAFQNAFAAIVVTRLKAA